MPALGISFRPVASRGFVELRPKRYQSDEENLSHRAFSNCPFGTTVLSRICRNCIDFECET